MVGEPTDNNVFKAEAQESLKKEGNGQLHQMPQWSIEISSETCLPAIVSNRSALVSVARGVLVVEDYTFEKCGSEAKSGEGNC